MCTHTHLHSCRTFLSAAESEEMERDPNLDRSYSCSCCWIIYTIYAIVMSGCLWRKFILDWAGSLSRQVSAPVCESVSLCICLRVHMCVWRQELPTPPIPRCADTEDGRQVITLATSPWQPDCRYGRQLRHTRAGAGWQGVPLGMAAWRDKVCVSVCVPLWTFY